MSLPRAVHFGFEVGSGEPVSIPLRHMVVTGQTQEAGKTTTLEALIERSGVRAVAFITKRGEGSFSGARVIRPYFREQADWQFVASILEASRGEKMRFERSWIIRASKGAKTLADVLRNVRKAMESARGMNADVYLCLEAYLEVVVPEIDRVRWAGSVQLLDGVNAMDLTALPDEMQHLVIRSTIDWVLKKEEDTVVVVPEAWKFIPEGRGTPVKLGAEAFIRQAAALRNYLWLDSQDIAGVEKAILKSVPVWILGVQRESNEVKRTLAQIPGGIKKPKPEAVQTLGLGEFYVCHGTHITKVYAQPAWLSEGRAQSVARGQMDRPPRPASTREATVTPEEARELREENAQLRRRIDELERLLNKAPSSNSKAAESAPRPGRQASEDAGSTPAGATPRTIDDQVYENIKRRLIAELPSEPALLRVLTSRPEIEVNVKRHVITVDGSTLRGRIARLIADEFFTNARTSAQVLDELIKRGADRPSNIELGNEMKSLCDMGFFTRDNKWYTLVSGAKVNVVEEEPAYR